MWTPSAVLVEAAVFGAVAADARPFSRRSGKPPGRPRPCSIRRGPATGPTRRTPGSPVYLTPGAMPMDEERVLIVGTYRNDCGPANAMRTLAKPSPGDFNPAGDERGVDNEHVHAARA